MSAEVEVTTLPDCDFCLVDVAAMYDFKTKMGPWANACAQHWKQYRASPKLGTGHGQKLVLVAGG